MEAEVNETPEVNEAPEEKSMQFIDSKGRIWAPRIDCRVIDSFERMIGVGVYEAVFSALLEQGKSKKNKKGDEGQAMTSLILSMSKLVFGKMGSVAYLIYESCRPGGDSNAMPKAQYAEGFEGTNGEEVSFDDFKAAIGKEQVNHAMVIAISALIDFFPVMDGEEGGGDDSGPFGLWGGGMSLNGQR